MTERRCTIMSDGDIYVCDDREDHDDGLYKYPEE